MSHPPNPGYPPPDPQGQGAGPWQQGPWGPTGGQPGQQPLGPPGGPGGDPYGPPPGGPGGPYGPPPGGPGYPGPYGSGMPPGPPPNKGNGGVIALVIILVVVVIGGGGIAGWFLLSGGSSSSAGGETDPTPAESTDDPVDDPMDDPTEDTGGSGSGDSIPENFAGTYSGVLTATAPDGSEEEWIIGISSTAGSDSGAISASVGSTNCTWDLELTSVSETEMNMDYTEYGNEGGVCADPGTVTITDDGGSLDIEINSKGSDGTTTAEGALE